MQRFNYSRDNVVKDIQSIIKNWIDEKPSIRSIAYLSRQTCVTDSSLRRLTAQNIKISDDSLFEILKSIFMSETYEEILRNLNNYPDASNWFQKNFSYLRKIPVPLEKMTSPIADEITDSTNAFYIYSYLCAKPGINISEIEHQFGTRGAIETLKLVSKGVVLQKDQLLYPKEFEFQLSKKQVSHLLPELSKDFFKVDHPYNVRILETKGISKNGYIQAMDLYEEFLDRLLSILKENPGSIPVIAAGFFDSFTKEPYFGTEEE